MSHVIAQIDSEKSRTELRGLGPDGFDWYTRVKATAESLLPKLVLLAQSLRDECNSMMNCAADLKTQLDNDELAEAISFLPSGRKESYERCLAECRRLAAANLRMPRSQQVSDVVQSFIAKSLAGEYCCNGGSTYPDLYAIGADYDLLPPPRSPKNAGKGIGHSPSRIHCSGRPSNVPDGLEVKTNASRTLRVDAHAPHPGLHLGVTFGKSGERLVVHDILIGYVRQCDYRECERNADSTTVKYSFGQDLFVSLL